MHPRTRRNLLACSAQAANDLMRWKNRRTTSWLNKRSRFWLKVEWSHTGSSIERPTNQRNSRLKSICSTNCRAERTV